MRAFDRDLIRGGIMANGHEYRSNEAEHMAAPTMAAKRRLFLPTRSGPHMAPTRTSGAVRFLAAMEGITALKGILDSPALPLAPAEV